MSVGSGCEPAGRSTRPLQTSWLTSITMIVTEQRVYQIQNYVMKCVEAFIYVQLTSLLACSCSQIRCAISVFFVPALIPSMFLVYRAQTLRTNLVT